MATIYPFPVLYPNTLDYHNRRAYSVDLRRNNQSEFVVQHQLSTSTLVGELVQKKQAVFFCTTSIRGTVFRITETMALGHCQVSNNEIKAKQVLQTPHCRWSPEVFVCTGVVLLEEITLRNTGPKECIRWGLSNFYENALLHFPRHSRIASSGWRRFFSMNALFHIIADKEMPDGYFRSRMSGLEQLKISITMNPTLFDEVENRIESTTRAHVLCTALTQGLQEILDAYRAVRKSGKRNADETDIQLLQNAEGLKLYLMSRGIPTWEDDNFNPTYSASMCYMAMPTMSPRKLEE